MSKVASKSFSAEPIEESGTGVASYSKSPREDTAARDQSTEDQQATKTNKETAGSESGDSKGSTNGDNTEQDKTEQANVGSSASPGTVTASAGDWQAIWAPTHNSYYFYNSRTGQTTWENPLQSQGSNAVASSSTSYPSASTSTTNSIYAAAEAAGIDPSLAHLDPTLAMPGATPAGAFVAKFNARTGAFTKMDARDPSHLSEAERAKRMSEVYFDVNAWEKEVEERYQEDDASGKKRKRPTKKDLVRFPLHPIFNTDIYRWFRNDSKSKRD